MRKLKFLLASVLVMGLASACSSNGGGGSDTPRVVTIGQEVELQSMDPQLATDGYAFETLNATLEGLLQLDKDGNAVAGIAKDHEVSSDGLTYTFHLREAVWSNGDPVSADDFVYGWQRLADPNTAAEYSYMIEVAGLKNASAVLKGEKPVTDLGVSAPDDKTVVVELEYPVPFFDSLMAFPSFFPVNRAFAQAQGDQFALTPEATLANGAFKMVEWNQGSTHTLVKNEDYYDADKVEVDELNFQVIKDAQSAALAFDNGSVDKVTLSGELVDQYRSNDAFTNTLKGYLWYLSINTTVDGLDNANLRNAIGYAYDKKAIADNVLKNGSIVADFIIPKNLATGPDGKDYRDTAPTYFVADKAKAVEFYDKAKADTGLSSFTFELLYEDTETSKKVAEFIKAEVETTLPGVTLTLKQQPKKNRLELMRAGDYQIGLTRWGPDYADPMTYLDMWLTGANYNYGDWSNADYDTIIKDATRGSLSTDPSARWEALKEAEGILLNEGAVLPVYQDGGAVLINPKVTGFEFHTVGVPTVFKNLKVSD
ncbi:MAG: peptide ABC transporter substrate-binding protein [Erysipelotrichaceae bacterium]